MRLQMLSTSVYLLLQNSNKKTARQSQLNSSGTVNRQRAGKTMTSQENSLDCSQIMKYMEGFLVSRALFTACDLGVFDLLQEENTSLSENDISQRLSTSLRGMQILLNVCESMRLLMSEKKDGTVYYQMSQMARRYLTNSSKESLLPWIKFYSEILYPCAEHSVHAVREGTQQLGKQFGHKNMNYFDVLYR
ncbi:acetylserotonin O-methyltransferase-like [Protopterus annectens]|uniref:acetylserotonin O-methyltransferase-like n=1 Tax=Protopterus annectens TaxID=7888 RepID=UPI001CFB770E|nr:acetylserotonin O-methyltransferase-like [Protopterus annectens]